MTQVQLYTFESEVIVRKGFNPNYLQYVLKIEHKVLNNIDIGKHCIQFYWSVVNMLRNFHGSHVEVGKPCSGYSGILPLIFQLRLAKKKINAN